MGILVPNRVLAYFPYFEIIKADLRDHRILCVSVYPPVSTFEYWSCQESGQGLDEKKSQKTLGIHNWTQTGKGTYTWALCQ
jgi:hypothetical protein